MATRIGLALMDAFGIKSDDQKIVSALDLHVDHGNAFLTVTYLSRAPDLSEIKEKFKIVPVDQETDGGN